MTRIYSFVRAMAACDAPPSSLTFRAADEFQEKIVRKTLITALMTGAAVYALPASAQGNAEMTIQTNIPGYCSTLTAQGPQEVLDVGDLTGATGQLVTEFSQNSTKTLAPSYYCNAPSKVTIEAEPLTNADVTVSDSSSFTNRVDYTASLAWGSMAPLEVASTEPPGGKEFDIAQATIGEMKLTLSDPRIDGTRNLRPVAGTYNGKVILTISLN